MIWYGIYSTGYNNLKHMKTNKIMILTNFE